MGEKADSASPIWNIKILIQFFGQYTFVEKNRSKTHLNGQKL